MTKAVRTDQEEKEDGSYDPPLGGCLRHSHALGMSEESLQEIAEATSPHEWPRRVEFLTSLRGVPPSEERTPR